MGRISRRNYNKNTETFERLSEDDGGVTRRGIGPMFKYNLPATKALDTTLESPFGGSVADIHSRTYSIPIQFPLL